LRRLTKAIPNLLTLSRVALCPLIIYLVFNAHYGWGLALYLLAGITDFFDGFLARRWEATTYLGRYLDPLSDKIFTLAFLVQLHRLGGCPAWFLYLLMGVTVLQCGALLLFKLVHLHLPMPLDPLRIGKWNSGLQFLWVGCLLVELVARGPGDLMWMPLNIVVYLVLGALQLYVFLLYSVRYWALMWRLTCRSVGRA